MHCVCGDELQAGFPELGVEFMVSGRILSHLHQLALSVPQVHWNPVGGAVLRGYNLFGPMTMNFHEVWSCVVFCDASTQSKIIDATFSFVEKLLKFYSHFLPASCQLFCEKHLLFLHCSF